MMPMKAKMINKKGFTLVEIVAAIVILALLSVGVMNGIGFAQKMSKTNMERESKAALVQEAIDDVAAMINYSSDDLYDRLNLEEMETSNAAIGEYNGVTIIIEQKIFDLGDDGFINIFLVEITGILEFMTPDGEESISLKRLAVPNINANR